MRILVLATLITVYAAMFEFSSTDEDPRVERFVMCILRKFNNQS